VCRYSIEKPKTTPVPIDDKHLQFQIKKPEGGTGNIASNPYGRLYLDDLFEVLMPAIMPAKEVLLVWSACRQVGLNKATDKIPYRAKFKSLSDMYDPSMAEDCFEDWDDVDKSVAHRVKVWMNQGLPMDEKTFMKYFKVPEKLAKIKDVEKRAELEEDWDDIWDDVKVWFLHNPHKKELEKLNILNRSDRLTFKERKKKRKTEDKEKTAK
jgi:hypothetical protein